MSGVLRDSRPIQRLGVPAAAAALRFTEGPRKSGAAWGARLLAVSERPAFELGLWCGTCPFLFERQEGSTETFSLDEFATRLADGVEEVDPDLITGYGTLLAHGDYLPVLLRVTPRLVYPCAADDYFSHEQVDTWGVDGFWGLPENPRTPYYRTFATAVAPDAHLYEFVVPMVPPTWNDRDRVQEYRRHMTAGTVPTAVAVSILDVVAPAVNNDATDYYTHWCLTHFLLDGHHKFEAAAAEGVPVDILSLVPVDDGLSSRDDLERLLRLRAQPPSTRQP